MTSNNEQGDVPESNAWFHNLAPTHLSGPHVQKTKRKGICFICYSFVPLLPCTPSSLQRARLIWRRVCEKNTFASFSRAAEWHNAQRFSLSLFFFLFLQSKLTMRSLSGKEWRGLSNSPSLPFIVVFPFLLQTNDLADWLKHEKWDKWRHGGWDPLTQMWGDLMPNLPGVFFSPFWVTGRCQHVYPIIIALRPLMCSAKQRF